MKVKKVVSSLLVFSMLAVSLVGCSGKVEKESVNNSSKKVQIEFWNALTGKNEEIVKGFVDDFNKQSESVEVKMISQGDYYENATKLQAALSSGNQPDITMLEITQIPQFASFNALADMSEYISKEKQSEFLEGLTKEVEYEGKMVSLPFNRSTPLLYMNEDLLEQANLDVSGPKNWDELIEYAEKLTDKDKNVVGLAVPIDIWFFESLIYQQGGTIVDSNNKVAFNNEIGVKALSLWQSMMKEGTMQLPAGEGYDAWDNAKDAFVNGKAAMTFQSTASLAGLMDQTGDKFKLNTGFLPAEKSYGVPTGGANLVMMEASSEDEKSAAAEFIEYMTKDENVIKFSKSTGYMPTTKAALESEDIKKMYSEKPQFKVAADQLEYASKSAGVVGYGEASEKLMDELKKGLINLDSDPKEIVNKATKVMQSVIDKNNK